MNEFDDKLIVWFEAIKVGELWSDELGVMNFDYDQQWLKRGFPISRQLPFSTAVHLTKQAHKFFANLLPEAGARSHIVRDLKIVDSDFELLKALGGECAGALSILPEGMPPEKKYAYELLSDEDLDKLILRRGQIFDLRHGKEHPRLSLAGAQDKCPILFKDEKIFIPQGSAASSHILKFELADYKNIPLYECFTTNLAEAVGLPVAALTLCGEKKKHYLLIKRYDRFFSNNGELRRLHQEDFCQALGYGYEKKYQESGGPGFVDCFRLLEDVSSQPMVDTENLLRWQIFNVLAGNSDGHAKNLSLLYDVDSHYPRLAPFYDLVCTRAVERIDIKLALAVADEFNPNQITLKHWQKLAEECGVDERYLKKLLKEMALFLLENFELQRQLFSEKFGEHPALQRMQQVISKQCKGALKFL